MTGWRMRPTASALGVVAIFSVMITATLSEADSGAIEPSINHPGVDEEERRVQEDERTQNQTVANDLTAATLRVPANDTANEVQMTKQSQLNPITRDSLANDSLTSREGNVVELQRDQSDLLLVAATPNEVHQDSDYGPAGAEAAPVEDNDPKNKVQHASKDFLASTPPNRVEIASSSGPWEPRLPASRGSARLDGNQAGGENRSNAVQQHENEPVDASNVDRPRDKEDSPNENGPRNEEDSSNANGSRNKEDSSNANGPSGKEDVGFTTVSVRETIASELRPIEQKTVEDIRAISFQVPAAAEDAQEADGSRQHGDEQAGNVAKHSRKDHSRPANNLLPVGGGKSTKTFYEIKPSIRTEVEDGQQQQQSSTTQRSPSGRKFVLPSVDSAFGKFGPYFVDGDEEINITARIGSTMLLDCKIGMLGDKKVTWVQHSKDSFRLLTVGMIPYSVDQRISLNFRYPSNWRLQIRYATPRDSGLYKCQIATHPPLVKTINVIVTAPELTITDDSGRVVPKERHLKAGSALKLRCEARDVMESLKETVVWMRGDETLTEDVSENRTTEISAGKEILVIISTLIVERASPRHAGNYSCVVPGKAKTTIAVHVLNGELPAAVHDGNGVSRAFLNLWLIHLTMSYVFSR